MNIVKYYTTDKKLIKSLVKKYQKKYTQNSLAHKLNVKYLIRIYQYLFLNSIN